MNSTTCFFMAILFSGTPCQVHAFKTYIKKYEPLEEKILTIDIICHGAPKVEFWNAYKDWLENKYKSKIVAYSFNGLLYSKGNEQII